jgi:hypothetical protein
VVIAMTNEERRWKRMKAKSQATIARVDKLLGQAPAPEPVVIETRAARWRREATERETARQVERERERVDDWLRRSATRDQRQQDHAHQVARATVDEAVAAEREYLIEHLLPLLVAEIREEIGSRIDKLQTDMDELKAARSFEKAVAKAGSVIDLPHKRVS